MEVMRSKNKFIEYVIIALGTVLMAISVNLVFEPMDMVTGGVSGFAIVVKSWTEPIIDGGIPIWVTNVLCNVPLFVAAIILKGRKYIEKTLYATITFTVALYVVPTFSITNQDYLLASVFGGIIMGIGLGMVFANQASTGGTDLFGALLQVKLKHYSVPQLLLVIDATIVLVGAAVFGINKALYAVISVYISSKIMDNILEGLKFAKLAYVISDSHEEIAREVMDTMERGVTGINVQGMYSNSQKNMLLCVVTQKEIVSLVDIVAQIDPDAFVIVSDAREVLGEGFIEYRQL